MNTYFLRLSEDELETVRGGLTRIHSDLLFRLKLTPPGHEYDLYKHRIEECDAMDDKIAAVLIADTVQKKKSKTTTT